MDLKCAAVSESRNLNLKQQEQDLQSEGQHMKAPVLIQGGLGAGISNWELARAVSVEGHLGVVSGTALGHIISYRLQMGDEGGHVRRALEHFPCTEIADTVLKQHYIAGGKRTQEPFRLHSMFTVNPDKDLLDLTVLANFVEVYLAKEGHSGPVGINYLEKIQMPILPSLYGAMLAGVDYVLIGAGLPRSIPGILDQLAMHSKVSLKVTVEGAVGEDNFEMQFDPSTIIPAPKFSLKRPQFFGIVSLDIVAATLAKKSNGNVDGFIIENSSAGGHNAPPRGPLRLSSKGEPIYGPRDDIDLEKLKSLGLPFWLAGSYNSPEKLREAQTVGAVGVQIGTLFAFCRESGLDPGIKKSIIEKTLERSVDVYTDPVASPTGFPFKVLELDGTLSELRVYDDRTRICDLGYLRSICKTSEGRLIYRCPAEPLESFVKKGGSIKETLGRKCLCNALLSNIGFAQMRESGSYVEPMLVTSGNDIFQLASVMRKGDSSYSARDVIKYMLPTSSQVEDK